MKPEQIKPVDLTIRINDAFWDLRRGQGLETDYCSDRMTSKKFVIQNDLRTFSSVLPYMDVFVRFNFQVAVCSGIVTKIFIN